MSRGGANSSKVGASGGAKPSDTNQAGESRKTLGLDILVHMAVDSSVIKALSVKDEVLILGLTEQKDAFVNVFDRDDLLNVKIVIPLLGMLPEDMTACRNSNSMYVLHRETHCRSIARISGNNSGGFEISPWLSGLSLEFLETRLFESFTCGFIVLNHRKIPKPSVLSKYNYNGVLVLEIQLIPDTLKFNGIFSVVERATGNFVLASFSRANEYATEIKEIDVHGNLIRHYRSAIFGDAGLCATEDNIVIVGEEKQVTVLDLEFNHLFSVKQTSDLKCLEPFGMNFNRDRSEIIRLFEVGLESRSKYIIIFRISKA